MQRSCQLLPPRGSYCRPRGLILLICRGSARVKARTSSMRLMKLSASSEQCLGMAWTRLCPESDDDLQMMVWVKIPSSNLKCLKSALMNQSSFPSGEASAAPASHLERLVQKHSVDGHLMQMEPHSAQVSAYLDLVRGSTPCCTRLLHTCCTRCSMPCLAIHSAQATACLCLCQAPEQTLHQKFNMTAPWFQRSSM